MIVNKQKEQGGIVPFVCSGILKQKEKKMFQLCIFDLDGTLTNTLESLTVSVNGVLEEMGYPLISSEQCRSFVGNGARVLVEKALMASGDPDASRIEEAMVRYGRIFDQNSTYHVVPYEGITELLEELKKRNMQLAVLSNKPHKQTVNVVETIFGKDIFAWIQGQQEGIPRKPDPYAAVHIADSLDIPVQNCLYIGDSEVDIATGRNAGMKTIGVTWGFRSRQKLLEAGAQHIADSPTQVLEEIS